LRPHPGLTVQKLGMKTETRRNALMRESQKADKSQLETLIPQQNFDEGPFEKRVIIRESVLRKVSTTLPTLTNQHIPQVQSEDLLLPPRPTLWNNFILNIWQPLQRFLIGI